MGGRGPHGRGGQWLWSLLGTFLPLAVRSHPCERRLLKQTGGRLTRHSEAFRSAFANQGPHLPGAHASRMGRAHIRGRRGRPGRPLIHLCLTGGRGFSKGPRPPFLHCPTGGVSISLSLSLSSHVRAAPLEAWLVACPGVSTKKSAPRVLPRLSLRPCTISRAQ
jgi:hypothetical protein